MSLALLPVSASDCTDLLGLKTVAAEITLAEPVGGGAFSPPGGAPIAGLPAFCRVAATLKPTADSYIRIEVWMPANGWNGRFLGTGNGGLAGRIIYPSLAAGVRSGYAVANTDMGTSTPPGSNAAAFIGHPEKWADWGYRATHEMTLVAKRIVHAFYGRSAQHAYFTGCSTGGEQALMEAQKYPADYDGIVAGGAANNRTRVHTSILWNFAVAQKEPASALSTAKLATLANAVLAACDGKDEVRDGWLDDPRRCEFDPASLECTGPDNDGCLTKAQVQTVRRIYEGPVNARTGEQIYPGTPRGSELGWAGFSTPRAAPSAAPYAPIFQWVWGAEWDWRKFDFDRDVATLDARLAKTVNATAPDLKQFRKMGHKLIAYHGWADSLVVPEEATKYLGSVISRERLVDVSTFYRLFMVPGMAHCGGGSGPNSFDALGAVVDWVERGIPPEMMVATKYVEDNKAKGVAVQRPICAYPLVAVYKGTGSTNDATSFVCAAGKP
ncbi:tannase/feruloyl esterase family alpha/beta hydrolase [uncultured Paludibaculum sp.]|uniref:tannase/feruloyl esterase family alpha/beta hydrolase n=1 Tax=uncultured Paludibaculum sp. TaxID=1765020 RepID=UPI002AAB204B|nr:tannase/feruloyl esterase family alpha/beta hydrolase [uncultured Paludibaculum sp.]